MKKIVILMLPIFILNSYSLFGQCCSSPKIQEVVSGSRVEFQVDGKIVSEELELEELSLPDYVFEENYNLPTLDEVRSFIEINGHLEGIPSADKVREDGLIVGDMISGLLEKIEELTLYTLAQQDKIDELEKRLNEMNNQ